MSAAQTQSPNREHLDYGLFFSDGLLDIFLGLGAIMAGILLFGDLVFLIGVFPATMLPAWQAGRKKTLGRLSARLGGQIPGGYQSRTRAVLLGVMMVGLLTLTLGISVFFFFTQIPSGVFEWLHSNFVIAMGVVIAVLWSVCGLVLGTHRFHLYGAVTLALFVAGHLMGITLPVIFIILGVVVTGLGILTLVRFLGEYPSV